MTLRGRSVFRVGSRAAALALGACAGTGSVIDDFDPAQIRIITPTEATSTCIGDISMPLCAVETFLACMWRLERPLCEKVGRPKFQLSDRAEPVRYRILSARILRPEDIPDHLRDTDWMSPGNAFVSLVYLDWHGPECSPEGCEADFFFKPTPAGWQIVSWSVQGAD